MTVFSTQIQSIIQSNASVAKWTVYFDQSNKIEVD